MASQAEEILSRIERLQHAQRLQGGLSAVTAAVVGVIANLAIWFALHVLFRRVDVVRAWPFTLQIPSIRSADLLALALSILAFVLLFRTRLGVLGTLAICAASAILAHLVRL